MYSRDLRKTRHLVLSLALSAMAAGCEGGGTDPVGFAVEGGDPERGENLIRSIGCGACHSIPGVGEADGMVGPPLTAWSRRVYIAGSLPNSPSNLIEWLTAPHEVEPGTAMPDLALSEPQARDIAAYLYTLD